MPLIESEQKNTGKQEWLTKSYRAGGENQLPKDDDAIARLPWCRPPIIIHQKRIIITCATTDFCKLNKYSKNEIQFLVQKCNCSIYIEIKKPVGQNSVITQLYSLHPEEIESVERNAQLGSSTMILIDPSINMDCRFVDPESLMINKITADKLLLSYQPQIQAPEQSTFYNDSKEKKQVSNEENILKKRFEMSLIENIETVNSTYNGSIHKKTQSPHKFVLIIMASMLELGYASTAITWGAIEKFIRKHIACSHHLKELSGYNSLTNKHLRVANHPVSVESLKSRVSDYKRNVFKIS